MCCGWSGTATRVRREGGGGGRAFTSHSLHRLPPPPSTPRAGVITGFLNGAPQGDLWTGQTGKTLFPAIGFYGSGRMASLIRAEGAVDYTALPPFDPAYSATADLAFSNGMHTVTSTGSSHTMAVLSRGFGRGAMAAWEFTLDEDDVGNETVCFGAWARVGQG